jgi:hypothetical protein
MTRPHCVISLVSLAFLFSSTAWAADVECQAAAPGTVVIDGLLDEWQSLRGTRSGDTSDGGVTIRCLHDDVGLHLSLDVADERLIRRAKPAGMAEDTVQLAFGALKLTILPASAPVKLAWRWSDGRVVKGMLIADSLQPKGFSVEITLPLASVPGYAKAVPSVPLAVDFMDADAMTEPKHQATVRAADALTFAAANALYKRFLADTKLKAADLRLDVTANVDEDPGAERVLAGGKFIGVISARYFYIMLPVEKTPDILEVKVVDLNGLGKQSILVRHVERGNGGAREVLSVWSVSGNQFHRTFAHELSKELGAAKMTNTWALRPRKAGGNEIVIKPGPVTGFTQATWNEEPAEDMAPILLPWSPKKQEVWTFGIDDVSGG